MWVVTYGDMMSLLLCFFVLLAAIANFDDQEKLFMAALESIRRAFGSPGQQGWLADDTVDFKSLLVKMQTMYVPIEPKSLGHSDEPGVDGKFFRVKKVRDGLEMTIGGPIAFGRFSSEIEPMTEKVLEQLSEELKGKSNKIEIRGHATSEPLPISSQYKDAIDLAYARARAVRDRLVALGVDPRAIRVSSAGSYEPVLRQTYDDERRAQNRRVEIFITQALLSDYEAAPQTSEELDRQTEAHTAEVGP